QGLGLLARVIVAVDDGLAVNVGRPAKRSAIGRKRSAPGLPFVVGQPIDIAGSNFEQPDIPVAVVGVGGDERRLSVGREICSVVEMIAVGWRKLPAFAGGQIEQEDVGIFRVGAD